MPIFVHTFMQETAYRRHIFVLSVHLFKNCANFQNSCFFFLQITNQLIFKSFNKNKKVPVKITVRQ